MDRKPRKGDRVKTTGGGRTANWGQYTGTVTMRRGDSVFVCWDGFGWLEDQMGLSEVEILEV